MRRFCVTTALRVHMHMLTVRGHALGTTGQPSSEILLWSAAADKGTPCELILFCVATTGISKLLTART